jgi:hypothetical protein
MINYITGNSFKKECNFYLDEHGFGVIKTPKMNEVPKYFVKTDFIDLFFNEYKPNSVFSLVTHNSDYHINTKHLGYLNDNNLLKWYAQNVDIVHFKIQSIPIGIANEKWSHGNTDLIDECINKNNKKENIIYCNFDVKTNFEERNYCQNIIKKYNLNLTQKKSFSEYLDEMSKSFFVVSPNGNGVDCHKTWEALYLKTIPIVTQSINIKFYENLPIIILNNWDEFNPKLFTNKLYEKIWNNFNPTLLTTKYFL